jgi:hypothetical protein
LQPADQTADQSESQAPAAQAATKRLKIGVALEGGGALGLAHIRVLRWFEDHHIPIDYIDGTSMGGLFGGLYATGKSPEELQKIVEQQKWDTISVFLPITMAGSLFATFTGGTTFGHAAGGFPLCFLGGPTHLSAYRTNERFGDQFYLVQTGYLHELLTLSNFLGKKVYAIGSLETAKMFDFPLPVSRFPLDEDLGVLAETAVGPFFFGGSVGDSGHRKWFFQLGRIF